MENTENNQSYKKKYATESFNGCSERENVFQNGNSPKKPPVHAPVVAPLMSDHKEYSHVSESKNKSQLSDKSLEGVFTRWLFGGLFAWHHLYLGREYQAALRLFILLHPATPGGFLCLGLIADLILLSEYLEDVNDAVHGRYSRAYHAKRKANPSPPVNLRRFVGQILMGCLFGLFFDWTIANYLPDEHYNYLRWGMPYAVSLGIRMVGNIGRQRGCTWHCLCGAYVAYFLGYFIQDAFCALILMVSMSALAFNRFAKKWRRRPVPRQEPTIRHRVILIVVLGICLAQSWYPLMTDNGTMVDLINRLRGANIRRFLQRHGLSNTLMYILGMNPKAKLYKYYQLLGLDNLATKQGAIEAFRKFAKIHHPDKHINPDDKTKANELWIRMREAYENLLPTLQ